MVAGCSPVVRARALGAEGTVPGDEVEAVEVDVPEVNVGADVVVEQRQLDAQLAQRLLIAVVNRLRRRAASTLLADVELI